MFYRPMVGSLGPAMETVATQAGLEESQVSDYDFAALSTPNAGSSHAYARRDLDG